MRNGILTKAQKPFATLMASFMISLSIIPVPVSFADGEQNTFMQDGTGDFVSVQRYDPAYIQVEESEPVSDPDAESTLPENPLSLPTLDEGAEPRSKSLLPEDETNVINKESLEKMLREKEEALTSAKEDMREGNENIAGLEQEIRDIDQKIMQMKEQQKQMEARRVEIQKKMEGNMAQIAVLDKQVEEKKAALEELNKKRESVKLQIAALYREISSLESEYEKLKSGMSALDKAIEDARGAYKVAVEEWRKAEAEKIKTAADLKEVQTRYNEASQNLKGIERERGVLSLEISATQKLYRAERDPVKKAELEKRLGGLMTQSTKLAVQYAQAKETLKVSSAALSAAQAKAKAAVAVATEANKKVSKTEQAINAAVKEKNNALKRLETISRTISGYKKRIDGLNSQIVAIDKKKAVLQGEIGSIQPKREKLMQVHLSYQNMITEVNQAIARYEGVIKDLESQRQIKKEEIASLQQQVRDSAAVAEDLIQAIKDIQARLDALQQVDPPDWFVSGQRFQILYEIVIGQAPPEDLIGNPKIVDFLLNFLITTDRATRVNPRLIALGDWDPKFSWVVKTFEWPVIMVYPTPIHPMAPKLAEVLASLYQQMKQMQPEINFKSLADFPRAFRGDRPSGGFLAVDQASLDQQLQRVVGERTEVPQLPSDHWALIVADDGNVVDEDGNPKPGSVEQVVVTHIEIVGDAVRVHVTRMINLETMYIAKSMPVTVVAMPALAKNLPVQIIQKDVTVGDIVYPQVEIQSFGAQQGQDGITFYGQLSGFTPQSGRRVYLTIYRELPEGDPTILRKDVTDQVGVDGRLSVGPIAGLPIGLHWAKLNVDGMDPVSKEFQLEVNGWDPPVSKELIIDQSAVDRMLDADGNLTLKDLSVDVVLAGVINIPGNLTISTSGSIQINQDSRLNVGGELTLISGINVGIPGGAEYYNPFAQAGSVMSVYGNSENTLSLSSAGQIL